VSAQLRILGQIATDERGYGIKTQGLLDQAMQQPGIIGSSLFGQAFLKQGLLGKGEQSPLAAEGGLWKVNLELV